MFVITMVEQPCICPQLKARSIKRGVTDKHPLLDEKQNDQNSLKKLILTKITSDALKFVPKTVVKHY